jgi:uncharacterized protein YozE (UPF0346 family)
MVVYLGAYWKEQPTTLGQFIETTQQFLQELGRFHPVFSQLVEVGDKPNDEVTITEDWSRFANIAFERAWDKKSKQYTHLDANNKPTLETVSDTGFFCILKVPTAIRKKGLEPIYQ